LDASWGLALVGFDAFFGGDKPGKRAEKILSCFGVSKIVFDVGATLSVRAVIPVEGRGGEWQPVGGPGELEPR